MEGRREKSGRSAAAKRGTGAAAVQHDVGRRIRARREERQVSLRELARRLTISPSALSQIETGKSRPSVSTLYAIVTELDMSLDELSDFLHVVYDVGGSSCKDNRFIRHSGREYGLVLEGTLEVTVGFDRYELGPGDSICFDSTVPHCLRNIGSEPVRGVWVVVGRHDDERVSAFDGHVRSSRP